jgi:hypothetical protein
MKTRRRKGHTWEFHLLETCCLLSATLLYRHRYHLCTSWLRILNQASGLTLRISDRNGEAFDVISGRREADDVMPSVTKSPRGAH